MSIDSLRIDAANQPDFSWKIHDDGHGFDVQLPRRLKTTDSGALVEIMFSAPVLREVGTVFAGRVFDTAKPNEVRQRMFPGDATSEIENERLSVTTSLSSSLIFSPQLTPNPFTPNGDGINDVVNISYKLLRVTTAVPVSLEIFDLAGRMVRPAYAGIDPFGTYSHAWDGTDNNGERLPRGLYLYRIEVDLQSERETSTGFLALAY